VFALLDAGDWSSRPPILLEPEGVRGDSAPSREKGKDVTSTAAKCLDVSCTGALTAGFGKVDAPEVDAYTCLPVQAAHSHAVAFNSNARPDELSLTETATLTCSQSAATLTSMQVRRLTPVECERLQGFSDNYTDIKPNGKPTPDGPRYKALGNSMAVPVMRWIGERIQKSLNIV
jgi:DNA (cytosine-5)-methyltransferase 1